MPHHSTELDISDGTDLLRRTSAPKRAVSAKKDTNSALSNAPPPGPLRNLDLLRSCAVLLVACSHFVPTCLRWSDHGMGRLGVMVFFVHTCLVLMMSMERGLVAELPSIRTFYLRRAFRIYPLSILTVLAVTCLHIPVDPFCPFQHPSGVELLSNLGLIQNLTRARSLVGPLWSLPWEVQMYFALPFVFLLVSRGTASPCWVPLLRLSSPLMSSASATAKRVSESSITSRAS